MNKSTAKSNRVRLARNGRLKLIVGEEVHLEGTDVVFFFENICELTLNKVFIII